MQIASGRMIHLGYARYWRSDEILGLLPIEEDRGPGRRTRVYVTSRPDPIVASRAEDSILEDMVLERDDSADPTRLRETARELLAGLRGLSPVLKRMLRNEEGFDVQAWIRRLAAMVEDEEGSERQEELFPDA